MRETLGNTSRNPHLKPALPEVVHPSYSQYSLQKLDGHGLVMREDIRDYTKLQEGPLCPLLRAP